VLKLVKFSIVLMRKGRGEGLFMLTTFLWTGGGQGDCEKGGLRESFRASDFKFGTSLLQGLHLIQIFKV